MSIKSHWARRDLRLMPRPPPICWNDVKRRVWSAPPGWGSTLRQVLTSASSKFVESALPIRRGSTKSTPHRAKVLAEIMLLLERKHSLPVVLHADHRPAVLLGLVIKRWSESADLAVRQTLRRAIGVFAGGIVMQHQHL